MNTQIQTFDNDLTASGIVTGFTTFTPTRSLNTQGEFTIAINYNNINAKYLEEDKIIYVNNTDNRGNKLVYYGYIDYMEVKQATNKAGEMLIVKGVELKDRLDRLIYPASGQATDSYTNEYLETVVKSLIQKNASGTAILSGVATASSDRQIPSLEVTADSNIGTQIDYSARYKELSKEIYTLLQSQSAGLSAVVNFTSSKIKFDVYEGNDYTVSEGSAGGILLSLDTRTALEVDDINNALTYRNVSVTAGQGEGVDRTILEVSDGTPTGYERRETYTDARDVADDDELTNRGEQKLALTAKSRSVTAKHNTQGSYQVGDDFDLGDFITAQTTTGLYDAQVTKLKYTYQGKGVPTIDVVLDFDINDKIINDISAKHITYDAVVGVETSSNLVSTTTLTASALTVTISDLDMKADGDVYDILITCPIDATGMAVELFANSVPSSSSSVNSVNRLGIGTVTGTTDVTTDRTISYPTTSRIGSTSTSIATLIEGVLSRVDDNVIGLFQHGHVKTALQRLQHSVIHDTRSQTNVTSLYLVGSFASGTSIKIYKR